MLLFYRREPSGGTITSKRDAAEQVRPYKYSQLESSFREAPVYHKFFSQPSLEELQTQETGVHFHSRQLISESGGLQVSPPTFTTSGFSLFLVTMSNAAGGIRANQICAPPPCVEPRTSTNTQISSDTEEAEAHPTKKKKKKNF